jgi:NAD(P)-dependent dehydrogenase (short-subunit alcohol dehydrogenase family)
MIEITAKPLSGKKGLVLGIANEHSIAYGCAQAFRALGAELAITYANDKTKRYVEPLAHELEAPIFLPCDVRERAQFEAVFQAIGQSWGELDFALHAIAFARPRQGRARERGCATRQSAPPAHQDFRPRGIGRAPSGGSGRRASADFACRASTPIARRIAAIAGSRSLQDNFPPAKAPNS